jgi:hypothetical protein
MVCVIALIVLGSVLWPVGGCGVRWLGPTTESMDENEAARSRMSDTLLEADMYPPAPRRWTLPRRSPHVDVDAMSGERCGSDANDVLDVWRLSGSGGGPMLVMTPRLRPCVRRLPASEAGEVARRRKSSGGGEVGRTGPVDIFLTTVPVGGGAAGGGGRFIIGGRVLSGSLVTVDGEGGMSSVDDAMLETDVLSALGGAERGVVESERFSSERLRGSERPLTGMGGGGALRNS